MTYLIIGFVFFAVGYKVNGVITAYKFSRDKIFVENIVNKMFEVENND